MKPNSPLTNEAVRRVATHASEGGNWYDYQSRQQVVAVAGSKGKSVKPTLHHARKLQLAYGVTKIIGAAAAEQLVLWRIRQGILSALTLPRHDAETEQEWMARVEEDMSQTAQKAAEMGSSIHAAIQANIQGKPADPAYAPHVLGAMTALDLSCGIQAWRSEVAVVSPLGFGTKLDLISDDFLIDFKGKEGGVSELARLETYEQHHMQLAAGLVAMDGSVVRRRAAIVFVSRTHPGVSRVVEVERAQLERGWAMFRALLEYTFAKDSYRPSWAERN